MAFAAGNDSGSIQVNVKDVHGKPAVGAKVWIERMDATIPAKETATNAAGESLFGKVAPGTYKVNAYDPRTPAATATVIKLGAESKTVSLALEKMVRGVQTEKKSKHYVYVAGETGSHIGGGHWVAVEDDANGTGANAVDKRGAQMLNQPQSFQMRPWQGPGN